MFAFVGRTRERYNPGTRTDTGEVSAVYGAWFSN